MKLFQQQEEVNDNDEHHHKSKRLRIMREQEEAARLNKKLEKTIKEIKKIDAKLVDKKFIENAPNKVIEEQKERLEDYQSQMKKIENELKVISN